MSAKISHELDSRLRSLPPGGRVRALVLLATGVPAAARSRRLSKEERRAALDAVRQAGAGALDSLDEILAGHDGKRLAAGAGSLGTVPIETTVAGILALAESDQVKAILEDQKVTLQAQPGAH